MLSDDDPPHYVDAHVGARIRALRQRQGVTQERLAERIGLTFQQVQKYEKGANGVSASKLFEIAAALEVGVSGFFVGLSQAGLAEDSHPMQKMNSLFDSLSPKHQQLVIDMMRTLSSEA